MKIYVLADKIYLKPFFLTYSQYLQLHVNHLCGMICMHCQGLMTFSKEIKELK